MSKIHSRVIKEENKIKEYQRGCLDSKTVKIKMLKVIWKRIIIIFMIIFCIAFLIFGYFIINQDKKENIQIKNNKETIYSLFDNFPESKNIYYTSNNLYSKWSIGPEIYQIDILAELTDESYNNFIKKEYKSKEENLKMKFNPNNLTYNWKELENVMILKSKDAEDASVTEIYFDENNKAIYVIAMGGN